MKLYRYEICCKRVPGQTEHLFGIIQSQSKRTAQEYLEKFYPYNNGIRIHEELIFCGEDNIEICSYYD